MSDTIPDGGAYDDDADSAMSKQTVTNDAVAGKTVLPAAGDGNDGQAGGAPVEDSPILDEHEGDRSGEEITGLRDEGPSGPVTTSHV